MHRLLSILPLLLIALAPARAANTDELLEPDKAFRFSAQALDAATVEVRYAIAAGYYLYRERFRFAAQPATVSLGRLGAVMAVFFGAGLLLTFTPCVLPMIPILSGIIVGEGRKVTRGRALLVSLAYVLGMAVTYTAIGIAAALSGNLLSAALQNAWILGAFASVFVVLALSMFRFYQLQLPSGWPARLTEAGSRLRGAHRS